MATPPYSLADLRSRRDEIEALAARSGVVNVRVFGSVAKGDVDPGSDVDLLVDLGPDRPPTAAFAFAADLEDTLGCHVDVIAVDAGNPYYDRPDVKPLVDKIAREAVPL
jgi:predicted nucleotidyltransferase